MPRWIARGRSGGGISRDLAQAILETIREPLLVLDAQLRVIVANKAFCQTFRVTPAETENRPFFELGNGQWNIPRLRELLEEIVPRNTRFDGFAVEHEFPAIGRRSMVLNARQIQQGKTGTSLILIVVEDVTTRQVAEQALRSSESTLRAILETAAQAILCVNREGKVELANRMTEAMFGYAREELLGQPLEILIPERFRQRHAAHYSGYQSAPRSRPMGLGLDLWGRRKNGTEFPVEIALSHIQTDRGVYAVSFVTDITERKQAEEALRVSEQRLKLAQGAARVAAWEWDIRTDKRRWSDKYGALYGLVSSDLTQTHEEWLAMIHPGDRDRVREEIRQAVDSAQPFEVEFRVPWPDGSLHWLLGRGQVFRDAEGKPPRMLGVNIDITQRKQAVEALEESRNRLRALSARLLTAHEEERRRISRDLHDGLCQKLALLAFDIGSLADDPSLLPSAAKRRLESLQDQAANLSGEVRQLAHQLHPSVLDELGLAVALRGLCEELAERGGVDLRFTHHHVPDTLPKNIAACLYRVTQEALHNISKHAKAKKGAVSIKGFPDHVKLSIMDSGIGFDPGQIRTGLGLVSMEERVRLVNGELSIASQPGKGTTINVRVPLSGAGE